ncbi:hypothetical protein ACIQ6Y_12805 [Streptomyces sp. NPDC096205]|uniref:hypothetical protein n=1 Tax=Streptomyces sp. NPDC096205 TaxID=3366081 RepID=UPI0037FD5989
MGSVGVLEIVTVFVTLGPAGRHRAPCERRMWSERAVLGLGVLTPGPCRAQHRA